MGSLPITATAVPMPAAALPLDLRSALTDRGWRDGFAWPLNHPTARDFHLGLDRQFLDALAAETDPFWRDVLLLAAPLMWMDGLSHIEYALLIQALGASGGSWAGGPSYLDALSGNLRGDDRSSPSAPMFAEAVASWPALRRMARVVSWTPWHLLPQTLLAPNAIAISHNELLKAEARKGRVGFQHATHIVGGLPCIPLTTDTREKIVALSEVFAALLASHASLREPYRSRLRSLCRPILEQHLQSAAVTMAGLRRAPKLPPRIWAGTGGYRPVRAIRLEARRRGGSVMGFEHGGSTAMVDEPFALALLELSVSDRFVLFTEAAAAGINPQAKTLAQPFGAAEIGFGSGDPSFAVPLETPQAHAGKKRVLYVSGPFIGPRQRLRPAINDVVKLDWQLRFARQLAALPIDLICQPHPEGALVGQIHPLSEVAPTSGKSFEDMLSWADVIVTDLVLSTTLWKAACSAKPIVLVDLDMCTLNPYFAALRAERFRVVKARYDDANLPQVNSEELAQAILDAPISVDPAAFRNVMAGPAHA